MDEVKATGETIPVAQTGFPRFIEEFALESSVIKVAGSEILTYVADEALQIHGGYGFTEEFSPARGTRDARINRIFEGTNEINRLFIPSNLLRRNQRGRLGLLAAAGPVLAGVGPAAANVRGGDELADAHALIASAKQALLLLFGSAHQKYGDKMVQEQEIAAVLSDLVIDLYLGESAVLRALKTRGRNPANTIQADLALIWVNDSVSRMESRIREALAYLATGDELTRLLGVIERQLQWTPHNTVIVRRRIAVRLGTVGSYAALIALK